MLILSRKHNESITITTPSGENIEITILEGKGTQVKVGIDAPKDYLILRDELLDDDFEK